MKLRNIILALSLLLSLSACTISYKLNGASIDYNLIKTITLETFANRASYQWGPMASMFNNTLSDIYVRQTKLRQVKRDGDLQISGEITNYDAYNKGVGSDGYSTMAELRMTVRVNFVNTVNPQENFESRQFSSSREYDATQQLSAVQDELVNQMIKDIVDQIFNATVANW